MDLIGSVVNTGDLLRTIGASFIAALAVAFVASVGIWGGTKYEDYNQVGRIGVATVGIIVLGIFLMVSK